MQRTAFDAFGRALIFLALSFVAISPTYFGLVVAGVNPWVACGVTIISSFTFTLTRVIAQEIK